LLSLYRGLLCAVHADSPILRDGLAAIGGVDGCDVRLTAKSSLSNIRTPTRRSHLYRRGETASAGRDKDVIKQDLIQRVVDRTGLPRTRAEQAVETVFHGMKKALVAGDRIELRGFGVFTIKPRKTGIGRNPRTGTEVEIEPGRAVRFKPGRELQVLNTPPASKGN